MATADLSSREPGLAPHWSPQPTSNLIGWTILSRRWVRSFGVGYSAVGRPNYLPDSLEDFSDHSNISTTFPGSQRRQSPQSVIKFYGRNYLELLNDAFLGWTMSILDLKDIRRWVVFHRSSSSGIEYEKKMSVKFFCLILLGRTRKLKLYLFSWESKVGVDITGVCGSIRRSPEWALSSRQTFDIL